jgi:hypothetical protein
MAYRIISCPPKNTPLKNAKKPTTKIPEKLLFTSTKTRMMTLFQPLQSNSKFPCKNAKKEENDKKSGI